MSRWHVNNQPVYFTRSQFIKFICNVSVVGTLYKIRPHTLTTRNHSSLYSCIFFSASKSCICLKVLRTSAGNFSIFTLFKSMVPKCFQYTQMSKLCNTTCSSGTPFCKKGGIGSKFIWIFGFGLGPLGALAPRVVYY